MAKKDDTHQEETLKLQLHTAQGVQTVGIPASFIQPIVTMLFNQLVTYIQSPEGIAMIQNLVVELFSKLFGNKDATK